MGDIKKVSNNSIIYENQLINILRNEESNSKKAFKLKGPTGFLFSNFAMLALAACGGGGGGGSTPTPPTSNNNAPSMGANATFSFTEDTPASFGIGAPTDPDGDSLTVTVQSIPTGGTLTLSDGTVLSVGSTITLSELENLTFSPGENLNSETNTIGDLVLTVTDGNGGSDSATFTFTVTAVNDAPSDITLSTLSITENSAGAIVGSISSTDIDSTSATYTISGDDATFFELTSDGSLKLKDNVSADFEAKDSYSITITATDPDGATFSKSFTVSVTDINDAPTAIALSSLVFDENVLGASVGTINVTDSDASDDFTYTISGNDKDFFEVVNDTLKLIDTAAADFEAKSSFSITITATDSSGTSVSENLTLLVNDLADPETVSGTVVDGYVSGSTVKILDVNGNTIAETTTNTLGQYSFDLSDNKGVKIVAEGGTDTLTGEAVTVTLTASKDSKFVSALTTIIDAAGSDAETVLTNLGLPSDFDLKTSNPLSDVGAQKINAALINIMAIGEGLLEGSGLTDGEGDELIVAELVNSLKASTDFNSAAAIKSIIDASTINLSDDIKAKTSGLAQNVADSIANSNAQILKAGSISQIAAYQKAVLDDENSLLSSVLTALNNSTTFITTTADAIEAAAREAALTLGVNVSPFITLDSLVSIKENIVAGDGVAIATISDPEGEEVTLTLGGSDAALFSIDASGKLSFLKSPNFSAPKDADQNNVYSVDVIATDASGNTSIKTILVNVLDVKGQGQAIDGYLVGATVWADLDNDGIIDPNEPTTTTDQTGAFGLDTDLVEGTVLYVTGGYDLGTGKPNEQTFKMTVSSGGAAGTEDLIISPVSTQISRAFAKGTVTLDEANTKVAKAYGLDEAFDNLTSFDPIELAYNATSDLQAKAALTAQAKNIMVSTLGSTSSKVAEYFTTEIAPVVRSQITDLFKNGTQILSYTSWDSAVDLRAQPRITIELEGFEELLAKSSDVFNDKIVEAILASNDLEKLFEMKKDGTGQFDIVIANATASIIEEIKGTVLEEMGFDPSTNYTTFKDLSTYEGEKVTFLGSTKTMGEWAVLISDVLDSDQPGPSGKVSFGPDGGVTDKVGKFYAEKVATIARHIEVITGKSLSELTDSQIDDLVDMGMRYNRGSTFNDSYSEWTPFDEYGQELWENNVWLKYNGSRFEYDSNGNNIYGNTGQWLLTPDQLKAYLKDPAIQLKTGNWGNDFTTYNWSSTVGDLGLYLGLAKARSEADVAIYMDALTPSEESMTAFKLIIDGFFSQGEKVFKNLVSGALDFTLDKFTDFVEKTIDIDQDSIRLSSTLEGLPVTTTTTVEVDGKVYELKTTKGIEWLVQPWSEMNLRVQEPGDYTFAITGGPDAARFVINEQGTISFKDTAPVSNGGSNPGNPPAPGTGDTNEPYNPNNIAFDDADTDGTYLITVTITEGDFSQEYDIELAFPDWQDYGQNVTQTYSSLDASQYVIEMNEHSSTLRQYWKGTVIPDTAEEFTETVNVTVVGTDAGNKYSFNGQTLASLNLVNGGTYTFDQSDASNSGHPLRFSEVLNGTHGGGSEYVTNVISVGTAGTPGAYTQITVTEATAQTLYYYCVVHSGMGGEATLTFAESAPSILGQEGLALGDYYATVTDTIGGSEGTSSANHSTNSPLPPSMGSTDWAQVSTFFGVDPQFGQSLVQPILMSNFGLDPMSPLADLINVLNASFGAGMTIDDPKSSDPTVNGDYTFYSYYNVLNYENLSSTFAETPSGDSPVITYLFDSIPAAGTSGSFILKADLNNGRDYYKSDFVNNAGFFVEATKYLHTEITVNWSSDGSLISFDIPDQAQSIDVITSAGVENANWENVSKSILTSKSVISENGDEGVELSFEISSLFNGTGTNSGVSLSDFIQNNAHYTLTIELDGVTFDNAIGTTELDNFTFMFDTVSNITTLSAETVTLREDAGVAEIKITLSQPLSEDFTLDYVTLGGDQFNYYQYATPGEDFQDISGQLIIPAGNTEATISIDIYSDLQNENTESFTVQFPQFQTQGEDGLNITSDGNISLNGSTNGTLVAIENLPVESVEYKGLELQFSDMPAQGEGYIDLRRYDDAGNPIKDNEHFRIREIDGKYYLQAERDTFDFDNPQDANSDNTYEVAITIVKHGSGNEAGIATIQDILVVVKDGPDPTLTFSYDGTNFTRPENTVPVASTQDIEVNGKTIQAYFASGNSFWVQVDSWNEQYADDSGSPESTLIFPREAAATYVVSGGADADKFVVINGELMFNERPSYDAPTDADGDNVYEVEISATSSGTTISKIFTVSIAPAGDEGSEALDPPSQLPVFILKETPETIGDAEVPKNLAGTQGDDYIQVSPDRFQYIHGGDGDDVLNPARDWGGHGYLTGGNGADIFLFKENFMQNPQNFGIRDNSQPWTEGSPDGIGAYDQNRDGFLDLSREIDWSWVPLISDFTPGVDKIGLGVGGNNGFNVPDFSVDNIAFVQGTGDMANHTLVMFTGQEAGNRGYENGMGVMGVLLDVDASTISVETDVISVGAQYEAVLGKIDIGATTVEILDEDGKPLKIQQLPNGDYVWFQADYQRADNESLHQVFTVSTDGFIYSGRASEIDYENPRDKDGDNVYEFQFRGYTFSEIVVVNNGYSYNVDWNASVRTGELSFTSVLVVEDDINDNLGKISIAETSYMNADGTVNQELIELVLRQITAVQGSMADIDFRSIAEEINFDFSFFTTADAEMMAYEWFQNDMNRQFEQFNEQLESTFERNLLSKYNDFTDANSLGNLVGDASNNIIKGLEGNETIFGKAGNDTIAGGDGDDVIFGDQGQDTLSGGPGNDKLDGGAGADRLIVDEGDDVIDGGAGNDTILFSSLSELPEFVSGGGGEDTLVLAGMPTTVGTTSLAHDNPSYNGVDLKKIVSAKETWTYTDAEGNQQNEEGWRNRLESIEVIDLRDSESLLNAQKTFETFDDFQLNSNYFTVTDYIGSEGNAVNSYKTKIIPYSEAEVGPNFFNTETTDLALALGTESVLDYTNLQNLFSADPSTGKAPVFSFGLKSIPEAGQQGTVIVKFTLKDGYPDYWYAGDVASDDQFPSTKTLKANIKLNWVSDGSTVKITMPPQTVAVSYESGEVLIQDEWDNTVADVMSVSTGSNGTPQLDLKLTNLFAQNSSATGIDMSAFFEVGGRYFLTTEFEGLDVRAADSNNNKSAMPFEAIQTLFRVEDGNLNWYSEDVIVNEDAGSAAVTINLSRPVAEDVTFTYVVYPATYGFINDDDTLETVKVATGADFADGIATWTGPNGEAYPVGTVTIPAGTTSATVSVPLKQDTIAESSEFFLTAFFGAQLSDGTVVTKSSRHPQVEIENSTVFNDVLNISLDTLWRLSWDSRTWTIRGDDTDTVRLVGYESSYDGDGDGTADEYFEPFRFEGQQTIDGVLYNIYDLWDARVLIEDGVTVIYKKRDLGKVKAGENSAPEFWYKYASVKENQTEVFGAVRDYYDPDGDTLTYSIDATFGDGWLFDINSTTGELTWKNAPDYESPKSQMASGITDFSSYDKNQMRQFNDYQVKVLANDGSGESNAEKAEIIRFTVKDVPDYEGYDPTNKAPFFKDMWGDETKFIDDATDQSIKIKGFDLDFDTLTWEITGMYAWGNGVDSKGWGTIWDSYRGNSIDDAPLQISSTGIVTPKTTLSYENGYTRFEIVVSITDGKSTPVTKQYYLQLEDSIADGSYEVEGYAQLVGYLSGATVWQDLDNDGVQDGSEPFTTTNGRGEFTLALSKATQDTPILVKGGMDLGTGLENTKSFGINSNLSFAAGNDWGRYSLTPLSDVTLAVQGLDRSKNDKDTVIDIYKALGFENGWVEGDGNYHGDEFHRFNQVNQFTQYPNDWDMHQFNVYVVQNLINLLGDVASKGAVQISESALEAVVAAVTATTGASGISSQTFSAAQLANLTDKGYEALIEALAETLTGLTAYDGFRLGEETPINIIDHETIKGVMSEVKHTPGYTVSNDGVMTLDSSSLEINRSTLQDALNLTAGAKGLKVEVELGSLPSTDETIQFSGKLIDGSNSTVDLGERAIEVRFNLSIDASENIGTANYAFVPSSESVTVIYTGEDGTVSSTTVAHDGSMVTIENPTNGGAPIVKVDLMTLFSKAIPKTDLSTYFSNTNGSSGDYYVELDFTGASMKTYEGQNFTKVVAPFKVADAPKPIVYISDVSINENRGWEQLEVRLSKPATETFTIDYKFTSDTAIQDDDYWWWTDWNTDVRQITFLEGQSTAIINLDVRNDDTAESNESFNIDLSVSSQSAGKVLLGTDQVTVTIIDDDGSVSGGSIDNDTIVSKVISKVSAAIATEIKTITDANSGTLNSSSTSYSDILVNGNAGITDVSAYISTKISEQGAIFDGIVSSVMLIVEEWTNALRGPNMTNLGYGLDPLAAATDIAALTLAVDKLDLSTNGLLNASDAAVLKQAIIDDIYTNSGFKFTGQATIVNNLITPQRDIQNSSVYDDVLMPAGKGLVSTHWDNVQTVTLGTSGNDTVTVTNTGERDVFYGGGAGNDVITVGSNLKAFVQGGAGNDTIKTTSNEYHRLQGGPGDDILNAVNFNQVLYEGGTGNDLFVIEASSDKWMTSQNFQGYDRNGDMVADFLEMYQRPGVIYDFKDGQDKIALKGDWAGQTLVIKQGTSEGGLYNANMSAHTFIYSSSKDSGGNYDQIIAIIANTASTSITAADFVTVDASYNQTAVGTVLADLNFLTSVTFAGGTNVGPTQNAVLIYNTADTGAITFAITGGNDAALFNIDTNTGALTFKTSVSASTITDFNRDGTYDVTVTASQAGSSKSGNVAVSVVVDKTLPTYSNLALVTSLNAEGKQVVNMTGTLTDDSAPLLDGEINITLVHATKGARLDFRVNNWDGSVDADGSFTTGTETLSSTTPDGTWYVQQIYIKDESGNSVSQYYRNAKDSSPLSTTLDNPLYLGNDDTTIASYSDLALKYITTGAGKEISITGKLMDDGSPLFVADLQITLVHQVTGARKYFYLDSYSGSIASDGTFETRSEQLKSSDPSGKWSVQQIRLTDDAGNKVNIEYDRSYDSTDLSVDLVNDSYTGDTDQVGATLSNFAIVETTNWEGKPAIAISGTASEQVEWLNIQLKHTVSGQSKWFHANEYQMKPDNTFETYSQSFENNDPSGTWYIAEISIKDMSGNETRTELRGSQDSSPFKTTLTNPNYSGGAAPTSSASDLTAPVLNSITGTVVDDGDGTYSLTLTGNATDVGGAINRIYLRFKHSEDAGAPTLDTNIQNSEYNASTGNFSKTISLDDKISGTYYLQRFEISDGSGNEIVEELVKGSVGSPLKGLSFTHTSALSLTDKSAPVLSNLTITKQNDGDGTYTLVATGTLTDATALTGNARIELGFTNVTNGEGSDFELSTSTFDGSGNFTISRALDNDKSGTWNLKKLQLRDANGNQSRTEIEGAGAGSPIQGKTFDIVAGSTNNASDKSTPTLSSLNTQVIADGDGTYTLRVTGTASDSTGVDFLSFRFANENNSSDTIWAMTGGFDGSGNFTINQNLDATNPGKYYVDYFNIRDDAGNEFQTNIQQGGSGSPLQGQSFTYAANPTAITLPVTSVDEEQLGLAIGKVSVNGQDSLGLYTITISGTDAASLEVSSKGFLRLKDNVKLDHETKTTLEFTLKATNASSQEFSQNFTLAVNNIVEGSFIAGVNFDDLGLVDDPSNSEVQFGESHGDMSIDSLNNELDVFELGIELDTREEIDGTNQTLVENILNNKDETELLELESEMSNNPNHDISKQTDSFALQDILDEEELLFIQEII